MGSQLNELYQIRLEILAWMLPLAVLLYGLSYFVIQRFFHPLAPIPGPLSASLSRLWMTKHSWDGEIPLGMFEFLDLR